MTSVLEKPASGQTALEIDAAEWEQLEKLAEWLDSRFTIPGTTIRFGLDSLLGLLPGVGDTITLAASAYVIGRARRHGVPLYVLVGMIFNAFLDWLIGLIPLAGDLFDVGWKANRKNIHLLKKHSKYRPP